MGSTAALAGPAFSAGKWQALSPGYEIDSESVEFSSATVRGLTRQSVVLGEAPPFTLYHRLSGDCAAGTLFSESQSASNADGTPHPFGSTPMALLMNAGHKEVLTALCARRTGGKSAIRSIADLRAHYGAHAAGKSDDELVFDYAPRVQMAPYDLALKLGYELTASTEVTSSVKPPPHRPESFTDRLTEKAVGGAVLGGAVGLLFALIAALRYGLPRWRAVASKSTRAAVGAIATGLSNASLAAVHSEQSAHDVLYVRALDELDGGNRDKATWARALASSDGDDGRARANYIKLRVAHLGARPS